MYSFFILDNLLYDDVCWKNNNLTERSKISRLNLTGCINFLICGLRPIRTTAKLFSSKTETDN